MHAEPFSTQSAPTIGGAGPGERIGAGPRERRVHEGCANLGPQRRRAGDARQSADGWGTNRGSASAWRGAVELAASALPGRPVNAGAARGLGRTSPRPRLGSRCPADHHCAAPRAPAARPSRQRATILACVAAPARGRTAMWRGSATVRRDTDAGHNPQRRHRWVRFWDRILRSRDAATPPPMSRTASNTPHNG